jgi:gamma-glutamylcyclotransferase (GGCT)/AIG2-like uncharacterized protein YtfP
MPYVFVYGTLRAGEVNDIQLAAKRNGVAEPRLVGVSALLGRLYDFGAYPGLVADDTGVPVTGEVYEVDSGLIPILDEIEQVYPGNDELFAGREVSLEVAGKRLPCVFYPVTASAIEGKAEIVSGDWVAHRASRHDDADRLAAGAQRPPAE